MAITLVGSGSNSTGTTSDAPAWVSGSVGDLLLDLFGLKPYNATPVTPAGWTLITSGTSGSVASAASTGSVLAVAYSSIATATTTGSQSFTTVGTAVPSNVFNGKALRFSSGTGQFSVVGATLADTDESLLSVSATGTVGSGDIVAGDTLAFNVVIKDDAPTHTSQAVTVAGCVLGTVTWQTKTSSTSGDDIGGYVGTCTVTSGSSTGTVTYTATSSVAGAAAAAVNVVRVREAAAIADTSLVFSDRPIRRNVLLRR